mmetsp:Transcript_48481/g.66012  ORF Transcript_48481/g.66012 Transcript_48481/m.66012 type:complete len:402 (-) Transcript_48481:111-1316(-)
MDDLDYCPKPAPIISVLDFAVIGIFVLVAYFLHHKKRAIDADVGIKQDGQMGVQLENPSTEDAPTTDFNGDMQEGAQKYPKKVLDAESEASQSNTLRAYRDAALGWKDVLPAYEQNSLKVWHRHDGGSVHSFKYEAIMPFEPSKLAALAREVDLIPTWHKFVTNAKLLEETKVFGGLWAYMEIWLPWPLKNRCLLMQTEIVDAIDDPSVGKFIVKAHSADYHRSDTLPTTPEQCPRLQFQSFTSFTPLAPDSKNPVRSLFTFYFEKTDYQISYLPEFVLRFQYKVMAPFVLEMCSELVADSFGEGSMYSRRMEANKSFYEFLRHRCAQCLSQKVARQPPATPKVHEQAKCGRIRRSLARAPRKAHSFANLSEYVEPEPGTGCMTTRTNSSIRLGGDEGCKA